MITKILFTIAVIIVVVLVVRLQKRRPAVAARETAGAGFSRKSFRWLAMLVILMMLSGTGLYIYSEWRDAHEIVTVRVIDARSGRANEYQAYQGELEDRSFRTLDGRRVQLAETERMETATVTNK